MFEAFRWLAFGAVAASVFSLPVRSQEQLKLFVGYSYLRPSVTYQQTSTCPLGCPAVPGSVTKHPNVMNSRPPTNFFRSSESLRTSAATTERSLAPVPSTYRRISSGRNWLSPAKVSPFVHALFGVAHQAIGAGTSTSNGVPVDVFSASDNAFATALGAGIDLHIAPFLSFRAIQLD
jgi:hypothetical protein